MDAYARQITPGEFPLVVLFLQIAPELVDVNVHPAKLQVKFQDSQMIFQLVHDTVAETLGQHKIASVDPKIFSTPSSGSSQSFESFFSSNTSREHSFAQGGEQPGLLGGLASAQLSHFSSFEGIGSGELESFHPELGAFQIIGQLWNSYIVLQSDKMLYYIDQHALAERIAYEEMKKSQNLSPELLLQPVKFTVTQVVGLEEKLTQLNQLGFDIELLGENAIVVYKIPQVFLSYPVDLEKLFNHVLYLEEIKFDHLLDGIYATRACKTSIKAGQKLSLMQMQQLVNDGFDSIPGLFVCQHGRPFFV